ncbi:MAG: response regulator [Deltaproteobacteria bacterium HGW-Deltaproteobacteria-14]|jgi:CheY-like chemotaxis protein|nr:MAG: response regulator [Deltaproteobacteria bacterium HGW-Deltaproteobacteria-14]
MAPLPIPEVVSILLVDDSLGDARLAREALRESKVDNAMYHLTDGAQALAFLRREPGYEEATRPDLILLDLNMPRMDGREVLAELKRDADLRRIPVVILTCSDDEHDIRLSYDLQANCFITKPIDMNQFIKVVSSIEDFWFSIVRLPK